MGKVNCGELLEWFGYVFVVMAIMAMMMLIPYGIIAEIKSTKEAKIVSAPRVIEIQKYLPICKEPINFRALSKAVADKHITPEEYEDFKQIKKWEQNK